MHGQKFQDGQCSAEKWKHKYRYQPKDSRGRPRSPCQRWLESVYCASEVSRLFISKGFIILVEKFNIISSLQKAHGFTTPTWPKFTWTRASLLFIRNVVVFSCNFSWNPRPLTNSHWIAGYMGTLSGSLMLPPGNSCHLLSVLNTVPSPGMPTPGVICGGFSQL